MSDIDELCINTLRFLATDAVEKAQSGHPGMPMGAAPMAYVLWDRHLKHNPSNPNWFNRDRFILSAGHGSMLLYGLLYMTGYDVSLDDLKDFRQWGSITPGHPEQDLTPGVETTTGPLGQGFANGVGMAMAERFLREKYNCRAESDTDATTDIGTVDHYTYAICSDGDMMEGISHEAGSLAGSMKLGKLIYLYDSNDICIEGSTAPTFTEDVGARFEAYDWHVQHIEDGNDIEAIDEAISAAKAETEKPSLIIVRTHIAYGSPMQDDAESHGAPLGEENIRAAKEKLGFPPDERFHVPEAALDHMRDAVERGQKAQEAWSKQVSECEMDAPALTEELKEAISGELPADWDLPFKTFTSEDGPIATRNASGDVIEVLADKLPTLIGGSGDLAPSTKTIMDDYEMFTPEHAGRNIRFGVREHAMAGAVNGMALHGGVIPFGATFIVFSDYMRPSLRLAAIMECNSIFIFTHDSIGVGEDGPTHQGVEHAMSLRAMPNMTFCRPADANETAEVWRIAVEREGPVAMALTRQKLPVLDVQKYPIHEGVSRGGYILEDSDGDPDLIIMATGSEVHLALDSAAELRKDDVGVRVVSMPCWELFEEQNERYRDEVLPAGIPKIAIEAGSALGWEKYVGENGAIIALDRFGASAPGDVLMEKLGFNVENVIAHARELLE